MTQLLKFKWLVNKKVAWALCWIVFIIIGAIGINVLGIHYFGTIQSWDEWLKDHRGMFLFWRIMLYSGTLFGWLWMRKRLLLREPQAKPRLLRAEICTVIAVLLMEVSNMAV